MKSKASTLVVIVSTLIGLYLGGWVFCIKPILSIIKLSNNGEVNDSMVLIVVIISVTLCILVSNVSIKIGFKLGEMIDE